MDLNTEKLVDTLNFATLNVNGLARKLKFDFFKAIVQKYDFFSVVESWCSRQSTVNIAGYSHFSEVAVKTHKKGRGSGGVVFYFNNRFKNGVHLMPSSNKHCMWIKLDSSMFGLDRDIFLGVIYLKPTTCVDARGKLFENLENDIVKYKSQGDIILSGDFNSRTGIEPDYILNDGSSTNYDVPLPEFYEEDIPLIRNNPDKVLNMAGKSLLEICKNNTLRLLNGRTVGDSFGSFTYYSGDSSNSCIDYTIVDYIIFE